MLEHHDLPAHTAYPLHSLVERGRPSNQSNRADICDERRSGSKSNLDTVIREVDRRDVPRSTVSNGAEVKVMFHEIAEPSTRVGSRKALVLPLSIAVHVGIIASALLVPLLAPDVLPNAAVAAITYVRRDVVLPPEPPPAPRRLAATTQPVTTA